MAPVSLSPAMAQGPKPWTETLGREYLARHKRARRPQLRGHRHDKRALRVAVRIPTLRDIKGSLSPGRGVSNRTGEFQCVPRGAERHLGSLGKTPTIGISRCRPRLLASDLGTASSGAWVAGGIIPLMEYEDACKRKWLENRLLLGSCTAGHKSGLALVWMLSIAAFSCWAM